MQTSNHRSGQRSVFGSIKIITSLLVPVFCPAIITISAFLTPAAHVKSLKLNDCKHKNHRYKSTHHNDESNNIINSEEERMKIKSILGQLSPQLHTIEEQLQIIDEIKQKLRSKSWLYADKDKQILFTDYEMALYQMGPQPQPSRKINHSSDTKTHVALSQFSVINTVMGTLDVYTKQLKYELDKENNKGCMKKNVPPLIRNVRPLFSMNSSSTRSSLLDTDINIHGPVSLPFLLNRFEVWTKENNDETSNDENNPNRTECNDENHDSNGGVCLVLGAGNQSCISMLDILHCIFIHPRKPVLFKHHPLRFQSLHLPFQEIFEPLIKRNLLYSIGDRGVEFTQFLLSQKEITNVHITGAFSTSQTVTDIYSKSRPKLSKQEVKSRITTELGCVSPVIITPSSRYSVRELKNCVKHIVMSKKIYGGSNCCMAQVIILSNEWEQKDLFRKLLVEEMTNSKTEPCYYPGVLDRVNDFIRNYDVQNVKQIDAPVMKRSKFCDSHGQKEEENYVSNASKSHPYLIECGVVGLEDYNDYMLQREIFGPVLGILEIKGTLGDNQPNHGDDTGIDFLENSVVPFVNNKKNIFGTLSCLLIHPTKSPYSYKTYQNMIKQNVIAKLHYGTVVVNSNVLFGYAAMAQGGQWGAHWKDYGEQSGRGYLGNGFKLKNVEKTVVYGRSLLFPFVLLQKSNMLPAFCFKALNNLILFLSKFQV